LKPVIEVENLGKQYRIGAIEDYNKSSRQAFKELLLAPIRNFRKLRDLTRFNGKADENTIWALKDVSFKVEQGDIVGVIGSNGAGKSTLLKLLTRITEPSTGKAVLRGRVGSLLEVGTGFHPEMTGRENIYLNGTILGMRKAEIEKKFDEIVAFSEVEQFLDTPVKRYSSGMYVRLAFAVAAHLESEILLIDEVLAVGDVAFQKKCLGKMGDISKAGRTVLFVSHNLGSVSQLCKKVLLIKDGGLEYYGDVKEGISKYRSITKTTTSKNDQEDTKLQRKKIFNYQLYTSLPDNTQEWGEPMRVEFDLNVENPAEIEIDVMFHDEDLNRICVQLYYDFNGKFSESGRYHISCSIPRMRLYMGTYSTTILVQDRSSKFIIERLEQILYFQVVLDSCTLKASPWLPDPIKYIEDSEWTIALKQ